MFDPKQELAGLMVTDIVIVSVIVGVFCLALGGVIGYIVALSI